MSRTITRCAWLIFFLVLVSVALTGAVHAATETVTLKNGNTYEVKTDRRGEPVGAENRQVEMTMLGASVRLSPSSDTPLFEWSWHARIKKRRVFKVTVTTPIDETVSTSFEVVGRGNVSQEFFDSEEYPTLWVWLNEPETTWFPFVFSFEDTQSDNTFELTQWLRFDALAKKEFVNIGYLEASAATESDSGRAFTTTETVQPIFDDRVWELAHTAARGDQKVREYILSGETVENWSELLTVQSFFDPQGNTAPEWMMRGVRDSTLQDCPNTMWNTIRMSETEALYEWRTEGCQGSVDSDDQYEIDRIIKGTSGLHRIAYTTKRQPYLPETERSEWIDRISRAQLIVRVGVADNAKRSYPLMPTRAFVIDGGSVAIQAGVSGDPVRPSLPFGNMKYPARYFVSLFNEADRTVWAQIHWYFPHKRKDKFTQKSSKVMELEAGSQRNVWWAKFGIVADKNHPLKIIISTDKKQKDILHTEETHMYFAAADVDVFKDRFDDFVSQGGGGLPLINGWQEMPYPKTDIPGTATDANLQGDIQHSLWKEESKQYRDCNHDTLRAESADDKVSAVVVSSISETGERNEPVPKSQTMLREFWWVRSCDVTSKYEVLLAESSYGVAEITVTKIGETN